MIQYESTVTLHSQHVPGVEFSILRPSFGRRMTLARKILELTRRMEFHAAGESIEDNIEAKILGCEVDQLYLCWGLASITGLTIDGIEATPAVIAEKGPEDLAQEIVDAIKAECGLTERERKN